MIRKAALATPGRTRGLLLIALCAVGIVACDDSTRTGVALVRPDLTSAFVSIRQPAVVVSMNPTCVSVGFPSHLQLVVTAGQSSVQLDRVTLHLLDGSNIGGPSITFASADLTSLFGDALIRQQGSRSFPFAPNFPCGRQRPQSLRADVLLLDQLGISRSFTATTGIQ